MRKRIFAGIVLFLLVLSVVYAQQEQKEFDKNDPSTYKYNELRTYVEGDVFIIMQNVKSINWELLDKAARYDDYYVLDSFYENLPEKYYKKIDARKVIAVGKGEKLNVKQIQANFDEIDNLAQVNKEKAQQAVMDEYGTNINLEHVSAKSGVSLKDGLLKAKKGSVDLIKDNALYKDGMVVVEEDGRIVFKPNEKVKRLEKIPEGDSIVTIDTGGIIRELPDGTKFNGKVTYLKKKEDDKGQFYIEERDKATINGVKIDSEANIYFDGKKHSESKRNYISFGDKKLIIDSNVKKHDPIFLEFEKVNDYSRVEENDHLRIITTDSYIELENRDDIGLIPKVTVVTNENSYFKIVSGETSLKFQDSDLKTYPFIEKKEKMGIKGSSPLTIVIQDSEGNNLIGTKENKKKMIISNYNEIGQIDLYKESGIIEGIDHKPIKFSEKLYFNYLSEKDYSSAKKIISKVRNLNEAEKNKIKKYLEEKLGVRPRHYFGILDSEEEADFITWLLEASEIASRNKYGVKLDPYELFTTFMMEGGIHLFEDGKIYSIPVPDVDEVEYDGKKYKVKKDEYGVEYFEIPYQKIYVASDDADFEYEGTIYGVKIDEKGEKYIEVPYKTYSIEVPDVAEFEYDGKKYKVKKDEDGVKYIEILNTKIYTGLKEGSKFEYDGKMYEVKKGKFGEKYIEVPYYKKYSIEVPDVDEVEYEGTIYGVKIDEKGEKYIEVPYKTYSIEVPDVAEFEYDGKKYKVKKDGYGVKYIEMPYKTYSIEVPDVDEVEYDGKKYEVKTDGGGKHILVSGRYYENHNLPVSGFGSLGTDFAGDPKEEQRLKEGGFWPTDLHPSGGRVAWQETGSKSTPANFNSLQDGLIGLAGILADRKRMFLEDFKARFGDREFRKLTKDEITFWTNIYYNYGPGGGKGELYGTKYKDSRGKIVQGSGRDEIYGKLQYDESKYGSTNFRVNALRRLATQSWLEYFEVFGEVPETDLE